MELLKLIDELEKEVWGFFSSRKKNIREVSPPADVYESPNLFIIRVEMPGLERESLSVSLDENNLIIKGSKKSFTGAKDVIIHQIEIDYSDYHKVFRLPENVDTSNIKATYRDGHLYIAIPKLPRKKEAPIKITIERS